jgi:hypothetical protein
MRRNKAPKRARVVPILLAGSVGYLLGNAHIAAFRDAGVSAADSIAQRFPQEWKNVSVVAATAIRAAALKPHAPRGTDVARAGALPPDVQLALFSPQPIAPQALAPQALAPQALAPETATGEQQTSAGAAPLADRDTPTMQTASAEPTDLPLAGAANAPSPSAAQPLPAQKPARISVEKPASKPASAAPAVKLATAPVHVNNRPGYLLDDAQIASIKGRLQLTPDQEQMWPAVEAALRNMTYTHVPQPHGRGTTTSSSQTAAVDPQAVQGLKSAAVPLIMSFNTEQKDEVRNIVHVMGLDQLASQF